MMNSLSDRKIFAERVAKVCSSDYLAIRSREGFMVYHIGENENDLIRVVSGRAVTERTTLAIERAVAHDRLYRPFKRNKNEEGRI